VIDVGPVQSFDIVCQRITSECVPRLVMLARSVSDIPYMGTAFGRVMGDETALHERLLSDASLSYLIIASGDDIGLWIIYNYDPYAASAFSGFCILRSNFRGLGIGRAVKRVQHDVAFRYLNLCCLKAKVYAKNTRTISWLQSIGYTISAHLDEEYRELTVVPWKAGRPSLYTVGADDRSQAAKAAAF
jgi:hypothetical protein